LHGAITGLPGRQAHDADQADWEFDLRAALTMLDHMLVTALQGPVT
jgi:hypothetical protein